MYEKIIKGIREVDKEKINEGKAYFDSLIKPLGSLGFLEELGTRIAGITGKVENDFSRKKLILVFASDNGVCEEGIASSPKDITYIQTINIAKGLAGVSVLAKDAGSDVIVIDVGIDKDIDEIKIVNEKICYGTKNILNEDAMTRKEAIASLEVGIKYVKKGFDEGYRLFGTGEMGIGNTTSSSALLSALSGLSGEYTVGYGAGLSNEMYQHKIKVVDRVLKKEMIQDDPIEMLSSYGGYDIGAMTGVFLGCSYYRVPVVVDGFIAGVSALLACKINEKVKDYLIFSHKSMEPGFKVIEDILEVKAPLDFNMRLGEGSGCPLMFKMIDSSMAIIKDMGKLESSNIDKEILVDIRE